MSKIPKRTIVNKSFTRRAVFVGALQTLGIGVLGGRLAWLQYVQGGKYKTLSDKNRIDTKLFRPTRGRVFDANGLDLALNRQSFRAVILPYRAENIVQTIREMQPLLNLEEEAVVEIIEKAKRSSKFTAIEIKGKLSWDEVSKVEVNIAKFAGVSIEEGETRIYPQKEPSAHIVGYVGLPTREQWEKDPIMRLPGFRIGKTGVEKYYNTELQGLPGRANVEVNANGREIRELERHKSLTGADIKLSIDMRLQNYVQERLQKEKSASAVVMDAHTGAVYAMVSHPTYDPNLFTQGLSAEKWEELLADEGRPLTNKVIAGQYPPASTFKMMTALAGLETGHYTSKTRVYCSGHYDYKDMKTDRFHCWKLSGHGSLNLIEALAYSCDTYFYKMAVEIGIEKMAEVARRFGLGTKLNFDVSGEKSGLVPDKKWKKSYYGKDWKPGETIISSIGQGYFQTTPLQIATMTARLVNGGYAVSPWVVSDVRNVAVNRGKPPKMNINKAHLDLIKQGMDTVVNYSKGTAYKARIKYKNMGMGGKTGTAQVKKISRAKRRLGFTNDDLAWKYRHHALFTGYAPLSNPRFVCSVIVEHGGGGSKVAAPIARDILIQTQKLNLGAPLDNFELKKLNLGEAAFDAI